MKIKCPNCSQHYEITPEFFGNPIKCETCNTVFKAELLVGLLNARKSAKPKQQDVTATLKISKDNVWKNWK